MNWLTTVAFVALILAMYANTLAIKVIREIQRQTRENALRPTVTLEWVGDLPVATIQAGSPDDVARWLEAATTEGMTTIRA